MKLPITLVVPTHNRHHYLERILAYYTACPFDILILDSSSSKYQRLIENPYCTYLHLPGKTFTQKLSDGFDHISTPFLVMCADDDFIIPDAIETCLVFLMQNKDYAAASGNIVCYIATGQNSSVDFAAMYTNRLGYELNEDDPFVRLQTFFGCYRSIFYAVHRTADIRKGFNASRDTVLNLYLNEYITGILPIVSGKYKELPVFYQVREYAGMSDDKTTVNLDTIIDNKSYEAEYNRFVDEQAVVMASVTGKPMNECHAFLVHVLAEFAKSLPGVRNYVDRTMIKRAGNIILKLPLAGNRIIQWYRNAERKKKLNCVARTARDKINLQKVHHYISKYR